jgi:hypothetical protein
MKDGSTVKSRKEVENHLRPGLISTPTREYKMTNHSEQIINERPFASECRTKAHYLYRNIFYPERDFQ